MVYNIGEVMIKFLSFFSALLFSSKAFANPACAVCTVAMGAVLGISRKLGINDNAVGVWIGSLILMSYYFMVKFSEVKKVKFKYYKLICAVLALLFVPVMYVFVPYKLNTFFGIDAFLISMFVGAIVFGVSQFIYQVLKKKNGGHAHFPFEKVVFAIVFLFIASYLFEVYK